MSLPPLETSAAAAADAADDARFDTTRERQVLAEETSPSTSPSPSPSTSARGAPADPTSLDATVRRVLDGPEDPAIEKFLRMGYPRDAVALGVAMWGDDPTKVPEFCTFFARGIEFGFPPHVLAGALAANDNNLEAAIGCCIK